MAASGHGAWGNEAVRADGPAAAGYPSWQMNG
jgi:hypothetical protein